MPNISILENEQKIIVLQGERKLYKMGDISFFALTNVYAIGNNTTIKNFNFELKKSGETVARGVLKVGNIVKLGRTIDNDPATQIVADSITIWHDNDNSQGLIISYGVGEVDNLSTELVSPEFTEIKDLLKSINNEKLTHGGVSNANILEYIRTILSRTESTLQGFSDNNDRALIGINADNYRLLTELISRTPKFLTGGTLLSPIIYNGINVYNITIPNSLNNKIKYIDFEFSIANPYTLDPSTYVNIISNLIIEGGEYQGINTVSLIYGENSASPDFHPLLTTYKVRCYKLANLTKELILQFNTHRYLIQGLFNSKLSVKYEIFV